MKPHLALSVLAPAGELIRSGRKTLEIRQWCPESIPLRDLVIVQNKNRLSRDGVTDDPDGEVMAIVDVESVEEWNENEMNEACASCWEPGWMAWRLSSVRPVHLDGRFPARLRIYSIDLPSWP
ncbi:MAG: ASCH domain-containing protein [Luteolibacter sp.]|uniref:ASCH domain-containing protein n=1 Tax=Luteolibacter sp. TaxID=1962973 RepID=UPI003266AEDD